MKTVVLKRNQNRIQLNCTDDIADILMSSETDPAIKELIVKGLMSHQASETASSSNEESSSSTDETALRNEKSATSHCVENASPNTGGTALGNEKSATPHSVENASPNTGIHVWTERQEDMLVHNRHERNDDFMKTKNHQVLWNEIAREVNSSLKCSISATQAMNKYYNLKKRWKEVIDSAGTRGSGSEAKYFRQKEAFDQMYGTKASTKPACILDSGGKKTASPQTDQSKPAKQTSSGEQEKEKSDLACQKKGKGKKRKSSDIIDIIEKQNAEFQIKMEEFHKDKMQRFDRLLDLYSQEVKRGDK